MSKTIRVDLIGAYKAGDKRHAQQMMKDYGIEYKIATPNCIADCWLFEDINESTIPEDMPDYIKVIV